MMQPFLLNDELDELTDARELKVNWKSVELSLL